MTPIDDLSRNEVASPDQNNVRGSTLGNYMFMVSEAMTCHCSGYFFRIFPETSQYKLEF